MAYQIDEERSNVQFDVEGKRVAIIAPGGGGGMDVERMWQELQSSGNEQIASNHISNALSGYATTESLSAYQPLIDSSHKLAYSLISGTPDLTQYQPKIDASHKLSASLIDGGSTAGLLKTNASGAISVDTTTYLAKAVFDDMFEKVTVSGTTLIKAKYGLFTDYSLTAKGQGSGGGGGGIDMARVWQELAATGQDQIDISHLTDALAGYAPTTSKVTIAGNDVTLGGSLSAQTLAGSLAVNQLSGFGSYVYSAQASRTANTILAAPNGSNGVASFRALVAADIPTLSLGKINGGTTAGFIKTNASGVLSVDTNTYSLANHTHYILNRDKELAFANVNATVGSANIWNDTANSWIFRNTNNGLAIFVDGANNGRKALIQVGHYMPAYGNNLGELWINKLGGDVYIGSSSADSYIKTLTSAGFVKTDASGLLSVDTTAYLAKSVFDDLFEKVTISGTTYIKAKYGLFTDYSLTAKGQGSGGGGGGIDVARMWEELATAGSSHQIDVSHLTSALASATVANATHADAATNSDKLDGYHYADMVFGSSDFVIPAAPSTSSSYAGYYTICTLPDMSQNNNSGVQRLILVQRNTSTGYGQPWACEITIYTHSYNKLIVKIEGGVSSIVNSFRYCADTREFQVYNYRGYIVSQQYTLYYSKPGQNNGCRGASVTPVSGTRSADTATHSSVSIYNWTGGLYISGNIKAGGEIG